MKRFMIVLLLLPVDVARPQIKTGSVIYLDFAKDEVTIAADSRVVAEMCVDEKQLAIAFP